MATQGKNTRHQLNRTPAPVDREHSFGRESYGANAYGGPSSIAPGQTVTASLNVQDPSGQPDAVLKTVQARGLENDQVTGNDQIRKISDKNVPNHPFMKAANDGGAPSGIMPGKIVTAQADPVRSPGK
jgi:hypothetical protein